MKHINLAKRMTGILISLLLVFVSVGCSTSTPNVAVKPTVPDKIKITLPAVGVHTLPIQMAAEKGYFKEANIDADVVTMAVATQATDALISGDADFSMAIPSGIKAIIKGADLKVVAGIIGRPIIELMVSDKIKKAEDLKGKKVAIDSPGVTVDLQTEATLSYLGLDPQKDVSLVSITGDRFVPLKGGIVDAAGLTPPGNIAAIKEGFHSLINMGTIQTIQDWPSAGLVAKGKLIRENPELVQRVVNVIVRATNEMYSNQDDSVKYMAKQFNLSEADALTVYKSVREAFQPMLTDRGLNVSIDLAKKDLKITDQITIDKVADLSFVKKAIALYPRK